MIPQAITINCTGCESETDKKIIDYRSPDSPWERHTTTVGEGCAGTWHSIGGPGKAAARKIR